MRARAQELGDVRARERGVEAGLGGHVERAEVVDRPAEAGVDPATSG